MFIEILRATSNVVVAYKTLMCATVGTLRTSSVNEKGECFLFPPFTIMAAFGVNNAVTMRCADSGIAKTVPMKWKLKFKSPYSHSSRIPIGHFMVQGIDLPNS
jgi:hypothetical protein